MHPVIGNYIIRHNGYNPYQFRLIFIELLFIRSSVTTAIAFIAKLSYIYDNLKGMTKIQPNYSLQNLNTFRIEAVADYFTEINTVDDLPGLTETEIFSQTSHLILGTGSNILFAQDYKGLVIHPALEGIEVLNEDTDTLSVRVGSGVVWDRFVEYAVEHHWGGVENLSGIPGTVGASPIQNIGAYGTEVKDIITNVEGYDLDLKAFKSYNNHACKFGYRTSLFKEELKNRFIVCYVTFRLTKPPHKLETSYGTVEKELQNHTDRSIATMRKVICAIRNSKLPDPAKVGNAGSFFKNPVIENTVLVKLRKLHPALPGYPFTDDSSKLSAAWLIEQAGCKGLQLGNAATHRDQPLVVINMGGATGKEILRLSVYIKNKVLKMFGIQLEEEVNIV
jgi:UDP-N-acetylmuramate dehydrogenase